MTSKKSHFLPLLLIGGGVAGAALLYGFGAKQSKENSSLFGGVGVGGSGDFLGSSGISKGYDSTDLGIEDYAFNRANPDAFALPSDGAANPENVVDDSGEWSFNDSGEWSFADTAVVGLTAAAAVPTVAKAVRSAGSKVAGSAAGQAVKSAGSKVAGSVAGSTVRSVAGSVLKRAGVLGAVATGINALIGTASAPSPEFDTSAIYTTSQSISTDLAAKVGIDNMVTNRQLAHATGLSAGKYPITVASKEETALVNKAVGLSSGDVLKVSGNSWTSYVPEKGMQVTYSQGGTLEKAVGQILDYKSKR